MKIEMNHLTSTGTLNMKYNAKDARVTIKMNGAKVCDISIITLFDFVCDVLMRSKLPKRSKFHAIEITGYERRKNTLAIGTNIAIDAQEEWKDSSPWIPLCKKCQVTVDDYIKRISS